MTWARHGRREGAEPGHRRLGLLRWKGAREVGVDEQELRRLENHCLASDAGVPMGASGTMLGIFEMFFFCVVIRKNFRWEMCGTQGLARGLAKKEPKRKRKSRNRNRPLIPDGQISRFPDFHHGRARQRPSGPGPNPPGTVCHSAVKPKKKNDISARKRGVVTRRQAASIFLLVWWSED